VYRYRAILRVEEELRKGGKEGSRHNFWGLVAGPPGMPNQR